MSPRVRKRIGTWGMALSLAIMGTGISLTIMAQAVYRSLETGEVDSMLVRSAIVFCIGLVVIRGSRKRRLSLSKNDHPSPMPSNHTP